MSYRTIFLSVCILLACLCLQAQQDTVYFDFHKTQKYPSSPKFAHDTQGWFPMLDSTYRQWNGPFFRYTNRLAHGTFRFYVSQAPDTISVQEYRKYKKTRPEDLFRRKGWSFTTDWGKRFNREGNTIKYYLFKRQSKNSYLLYSFDSVYYRYYMTCGASF